jgi:hypothetical protein
VWSGGTAGCSCRHRRNPRLLRQRPGWAFPLRSGARAARATRLRASAASMTATPPGARREQRDKCDDGRRVQVATPPHRQPRAVVSATASLVDRPPGCPRRVSGSPLHSSTAPAFGVVSRKRRCDLSFVTVRRERPKIASRPVNAGTQLIAVTALRPSSIASELNQDPADVRPSRMPREHRGCACGSSLAATPGRMARQDVERQLPPGPLDPTSRLDDAPTELRIDRPRPRRIGS